VPLPWLLIDVRSEELNCGPFLHERTSKETDFYFTLSYRSGSTPLMTYQRNLDGYKQAIPKASLPKVIRDAITVTRELGCRYLLVDVLCIV
jgi:hypothetical protein